MAKNTRPKRVSSLGSLRAPEEINENVIALTNEKSKAVKKPTPVSKPVVAAKPKTQVKAKTVVKKPAAKEVVKFVKLGDHYHMTAKIAAARKRMSIKAYLEGLVAKDNPDEF